MKKVFEIPFDKVKGYSNLYRDYVLKNPNTFSFYNNYPDLEGFGKQLEEKKNNQLSSENRQLLAEVLENQYAGIDSPIVCKNIELLKKLNTYTIVTGHQLNLFTGPVFFIYKILTAIKYAERLNNEFSKINIVPIYWMATEDHDFEEINHFYINKKKIIWSKETSGAVGELIIDGFEAIEKVIENELGVSHSAEKLMTLFRKSYKNNESLARCMRVLVNELFSSYGLVILDANDVDLKRILIPHFEKEFSEEVTFEEVTKANDRLKSVGYSIQVNPRKLNVFYIKKTLRERIVFEDNEFRLLNINKKWSIDEILEELRKFPERFSPNVLLRPLYQEVILPNLGYIGGSGELAYWLQLKGLFTKHKQLFPILVPRHSVIMMSEKQIKKIKALRINFEDFLKPKIEFEKIVIKKNSVIQFDFEEQIKFLKKQFEGLMQIADRTDKSFLTAVKSQEVKQIKGLKNLEKRLLKAEKRQLKSVLKRSLELYQTIYPLGTFQERIINFSEIEINYSGNFIKAILKEIKPFNFNILIFS